MPQSPTSTGSAAPESPHFALDPHYREFALARNQLTEAPTLALSKIEQLAYQSSPVSMVYLADAMLFGTHYARDMDDAEGWYRAAADLGLVHGNHGMARIAWKRGDFTRAKDLLEIAVAEGFAPSMNVLALMHFRGKGVEKAPMKARALWESGWERGHVWSLRNLAHHGARGTFGAAAIPRAIVLAIRFVLTPLLLDVDFEDIANGAWPTDETRP